MQNKTAKYGLIYNMNKTNFNTQTSPYKITRTADFMKEFNEIVLQNDLSYNGVRKRYN